MKNLTRLGINILLFTLLAKATLNAQTNRAPSSLDEVSTFANFNSTGLQSTRFDTAAAAIDSHDGEIAYFDGVFYLYGTSYDCGYEWGIKGAPFCGFKVYTSKDLVNWTDKGFLFDAKTSIWQSRCNGNTYGCYRPHVIYNKKNNMFVLWINVYDNKVGYRVFGSTTPEGPFTEMDEPKLSINRDAPVAGLNHGDHDLFIDDDGTAYLAFTDWRAGGGSIMVEKLNDDYTSGSGSKNSSRVTKGNTEAPAMMKREGKYYILYSDPNCGYCAGTGTSYRFSKSPLGPWSPDVESPGISVSKDSCGGQPSFVSTLKLKSGVVFLYGSDLWNNAAKNQALANYYWAPLTFAADGSINPIARQETVSIAVKPDLTPVPAPVDLDSTSGTSGFKSHCDISGNIQRSQSFVATRTGTLSAVSFCTFKSGSPNAGLAIEIYQSNEAFQPTGSALSSILVLPESIGWSPKLITVRPDIAVKSGVRYAIVLKSNASNGNYGFEYSDSAPYPGGGEAYSGDGGQTFRLEPNRSSMFRTFIHPN
jgi:hypothetical protein